MTESTGTANQKTETGQPKAAETSSVRRLEERRPSGSGKTSRSRSAKSDTRPVKETQPLDLSAPEYYLNRELTWLAFNRRVLHEAQDPRTPLLERVKFAAIVSSNLDEFYMKRIGGLKQQVGAGLQTLSVDGRTPLQQIEECDAVVRDIEAQKDQLYAELLPLLGEKGIHIKPHSDLSSEQQSNLRNYYFENIFPLVTPQAVDPAHPFPFISNLSLNLLVTLKYEKSDDVSLCRVKIPTGSGIPRFIRLGDSHTFVALEDVISNNLDLLFPGMEVLGCELFFVTRNASTEHDEAKANDLLVMIESELRDRRFAPIVRVIVEKGMNEYRRGLLAAELGLDEKSDVYETASIARMADLFEICGLKFPELRDPPHQPSDHGRLRSDRSIFYSIREHGSVLLQHPYESFSNSVERFLEEACRDPKVRAIKMSLYRTSAETRIVDYLVEAAQNGKQVAVAVELKARFDEAANIRWANRMEEAGVHVTYGILGLKTHCKVIMVVRQDYNGIRRYVHIGTGNYHAGTARLYSDLGLLTCDDAVGKDVTELFNYLTTGFTPKRDYTKIVPAPKHLKKLVLDNIEREIAGHTADDPGLIRLKTNALEDKDVTEALYRASQAGVKIDLMVRDTCRIRPGIPGLSENISVISTVGRFLEHSRIYYFHNGGDEEYYIGSADLMMRNLESRVEVMVRIDPAPLQQELRELLDTYLTDQRNAWEMQSDGTFVQRKPTDDTTLGSQELLIQHAESRLKEAKRLRKRKMRGAVA